MKVGVLVPTLGNRPNLLEFAKRRISEQTYQPDFIEIVDDSQIVKPTDLTWRYRLGVDRLLSKGADVIIFWEDDDWYSKNYIETLLREWRNNGHPPIFGIEFSLYYHILAQRYWMSLHPRRASAMSTMVTSAGISDFAWPNDSEIWLDIHLWKKIQGVAVSIRPLVAVGIKHGLGECGGVGHNRAFKKYDGIDRNYKYMESIVGEDIEFYKKIAREKNA
jgi:hypothetical protein